MSNKVVLSVSKVDKCPLYMVGERMVLAPPEVLKLNSDRICAIALRRLYPLAEEQLSLLQRPDYQPREAPCPGCQGGIAHFRIEPFHSPRAMRSKTSRLERDAMERKKDLAEGGHGPFLSQLPAEVVKTLLENCKPRKYMEPTVILREGEEGRHFHVVGKGEVEVVKNADGKDEEVVLALLGKGDCFGEMSLFTGEPISATVRTRGDGVAILSCDKETLDGLMVRLPALAMHFSRLLSQRLKITSQTLQTELQRAMSGRLDSMKLPDVIQTLSSAKMTGMLQLTSIDGQQTGTVAIEAGRVVGAILGDIPGEEAFYGLIDWEDGDFKFRSSEEIVRDGPIERNTTNLLIEAMRRMDEARRHGTESPA